MIKEKDVLSLDELSREEILRVLDLADRLKAEKRRGRLRPRLRNKSLAMIFQKPSTRTRSSFEVGMFELGGHALNLGASEIQLARGETVEDTARTLSGYVDLIMARVYSHRDVKALAKAARVPVINGLSDAYHPCQVLADLQTIREVKGGLTGLRVAWVGDGNNVCNTLMLGCAKVGMDFVAACPQGYEPLPAAHRMALKAARVSGSKVTVLRAPTEAVAGADIVVTDTFVSMGAEKEREERLRVFLPAYQVNRKLLRRAKPDTVFMHCLPAHRGEEVTAGVIDGKHSAVWREAENRLHAQKALMCMLLLDEEAAFS